jgi:hypothetical protein
MPITEYRDVPEFITSIHYATSGPVTLDPDQTWVDQGGNVIENFAQKGTLLGRITATGLYGPYSAGAIDGRETPLGILLEDVSFVGSNNSSVMVVHGWVNASALIGLDIGARAALQAIGLNFVSLGNMPAANIGLIAGTVTDPSDNALAGAVVTLAWPDGTTQTAITDENGDFVFPNLPEGEYEITIEHDYYDTYTETVEVGHGETETVEAQMSEGGYE